METWLIATLIGIGAFIISLFFEEARDFYEEQLEEIWNGILYLISFEWTSDLWEFISSGFEDLSEFSVYGLFFGLIGVLVIYYLRDYMLNPFLVHFSPAMAIFWGAVTYIGTFMGGYLLGKAFENN